MKEKYAKGAYFKSMFPSAQPKYYVKPIDCELGELKKKSAMKLVLMETAKNKVDYSIENFLRSVEKNLQLMEEKKDCEACVKTFFLYAEEHPIYRFDSLQLTIDIKEFYNQRVCLSQKQIIQLARDTIQQSKCRDWFANRRLRLSASSNIHKIKSRTRKSIESLVQEILFPSKADVEATSYGIENEPKAKTLYEKIYGVRVKSVGLVVHFLQNWLCASMDGVVVDDDIIKKIVEFKCPWSCKEKKIVDHVNQCCNVKYLELVDGVVHLKKNHFIYTQCQVQMYVSGMTSCDLFVYSPTGSIRVPVYRDEYFLQKVIPLCENFYFDYYLIALQKEFLKRENLSGQKQNEIDSNILE